MLEKGVNSLLGLIEGIAIDRGINAEEIQFLDAWLDLHRKLRRLHPFSELVPVIEQALADRVLTADEHQDLVWLCQQLATVEYFNRATADLQRLQAVLGGVAADGLITEVELRGLRDWLNEREHLRGCWPYEEIVSLVTGVLADHKIDAAEHQMLLRHFSEFVALPGHQAIARPQEGEDETIGSCCAVCPEITFKDALFCFTGASARYTRKQMKELVESLGGRFTDTPSPKVDYLVVGANGNPCWVYACCGRKVEKVKLLRRQGAQILIVHELDFHDAVLDVGG